MSKIQIDLSDPKLPKALLENVLKAVVETLANFDVSEEIEETLVVKEEVEQVEEAPKRRGRPTKQNKTTAKKEPEKKEPAKKTTKKTVSKSDPRKDELMELCAELEEVSSKDEVKAILQEFGYKSAGLVDVEDDSFDDLIELLKESIGDFSEEETENSGSLFNEKEEEEDEEQITVDLVKQEYQAYVADTSPKQGKALLSEYGCKTMASIGKLSNEDLENLYYDLVEEE